MKKHVVGIDEVGRGPIAGPVAVCAFCGSTENIEHLLVYGKESKLPLRDSKKLTKKQREKWFEFLKSEKEKGNCDFAVSLVSAEWIDKIGISRAIKKALNNSLSKLKIKDPESTHILLDGGLKAPDEYISQKTFIKGDELHPIISFASIVAKVSRDNLMEKYAVEYPKYSFEHNAGYGTASHYEAIKKHGLTPLHRKSFLKS
ncbi:MAG: ribonuclease HII [Minisyncoccia bacterium]